MSNNSILVKPIGLIHSEHTIAENTPIQPVYATGCMGRVVVFDEFAEGLCDIEGFSHIYLLYSFDRASAVKLKVKPFMEDVARGVFATRAPCRPNSIGLSVVRLIKREGNVLHVDGLDILDGTPLLDIKPYTAKFDRFDTTKNGWQDDIDDNTANRRGRRGYSRDGKESAK